MVRKKPFKRRISARYKKFFNADGTKKETGIEKKIRELLLANNIGFKQEYQINYRNFKKRYDFLVFREDEYYFLIECDGSYYHAEDTKTGKVKKSKDLKSFQKKNVRNDRIKNKIAENLGIPLIRLWESEINSDIDSCLNKIKQEISRQDVGLVK